MNDLAHGEVVAALSSNVLAVVVLLGAVVAWVVWVVRRARGQDVALVRLTPARVVAVTAVFLVFTLVRNTPWGAWLAP